MNSDEPALVENNSACPGSPQSYMRIIQTSRQMRPPKSDEPAARDQVVCDAWVDLPIRAALRTATGHVSSDLLRQAIMLLLTSGAELINALRQDATTNSRLNMRRAAQSLKVVSTILGINVLTQHCTRLEIALLDGIKIDVAATLEAIATEFEQAEPSLLRLCAT